jgi:hypothetical protein
LESGALPGSNALRNEDVALVGAFDQKLGEPVSEAVQAQHIHEHQLPEWRR